MSTLPLHDAAYRRELGNGLVVRWSTSADAERIVQLYADVFRNAEDAPPQRWLVAWSHDLVGGRHPLITPHDFAVVEDLQRQAIVATTGLMRQTWSFGGIPLQVGRPENVATEVPYRNRGLIRTIFELIHARSEARGDLVQGITGIPFYYRQFGYEYALDLWGNRSVDFTMIPALPAGASEPYRLRLATHEDIPWLLRLYDRERTWPMHGTPWLVSAQLDAAYWEFMFNDARPESGMGWTTQVIVSAAGETVGYVLTKPVRWGAAITVNGMMVEPGVSLMAVLPAVLRALQQQAPALSSERPDARPVDTVLFALGRQHPVYEALGPRLAAKSMAPHTWYVRVPDLPRLLRHLAPVLEQRLVNSVAAGYSGELKFDFYRSGLRLVFERGRLITAEDWRAPVWDANPQAGFPGQSFVQLLFGHRSLAELHHILPDAWASDEATPLINILFPTQPSWVLPIS